MGLPEEENFPRGGKIVRKRTAPEIENLFSTAKSPKPKKAKKSKKRDPRQSTDDVFQSSLIIQGSLTYNKLQTGMVVLGCVRHLTNFSLGVELPGLCFALVKITNITDTFITNLNKKLENNDFETDTILRKMFSVGEFLPVKIVNIEARDTGTHVEGSINPRDIYVEQNHDSFTKGMLVWASVSSEADHGYEMSLGVKNCRAFLPFKNTDVDKKYMLGKPIWCVVHKNDSTASSSILRVSAKFEHVNNATLDIESLHKVIPGMKVEFLSERITGHGIQGKFSENFIGFVDEHYLAKPLKRVSDYNEGKLLTALVLYTEPATKITHLSLRNLEVQNKPDLNVGDIVQAEVFNKSFNGLSLILPNKQKGFVTNKRLINSFAKKDNLNINEAITLKFPNGSKHQCRIMDYNYLSRMYICTSEQSIVKESVFTPKDLSVAQSVKVTLLDIKDEGFVVTSGHIRGFVPNLHITNVAISENIKRKYKQGQILNARVLSVGEDKVLFTLKPGLVEAEECLTKTENAEIGKKYSGVVVKVTDKGALIVFFGNVKGWLTQQGMGIESSDPSRYFFLGQVVKVFIWKIDDSRILLSLFKPQVNLSLTKIGGRFRGIVRSVNEDGISVQLENSKRHGFVPNNHLSSSLSLCHGIKRTFKAGDTMPDLMYIGGVKPQMFSRREALVMKNKKVPTLDMINEGSIIRCSFKSNTNKGVYVTPLISDCSDPTLVLIKDVTDEEIIPEFVPHQALLARITNINRKKKEVGLTIKFQNVFNKQVESVVNLFAYYLTDVSYLRQYGHKNKWDLCQYSPGDQVACKVEKVGTHGGCVVSLPNGLKGLAVPSLCTKSLKEGDSLTGTIISQDFDKNFVEICLRSDISSRINKLQDGKMKSPVTSCIANKLLVKDDCVIAIVKHPDANGQLVYIPTRKNENDNNSCLSFYEDKKLKICVCGKVKQQLVGISKKLFLKLDDKPKQDKLNQRKIVEKTNVDIEKQEDRESENIEVRRSPKDHAVGNSDTDSDIEKNNEVDLDSDIDESNDKQRTSQKDNFTKSTNTKPATLPGVTYFFNPLKKETATENSSSEDDDEAPTEKKQKKLSPTEKAELLRQEEARISKIEKELADASQAPESAEQFDRLLLANPNSSELWTKYISFYIAATEIDKARAIARKALDAINMTFTQEKFNIWIVLLNLENTFGTKESFDRILEDALKFNDSLQIYLRVIEMFAEDGKYGEMEEKIKKIRSKYRQEPTMWFELAKTYYQIGKFKEARNCKDSALKSITDKKTQMNLIVRFAIMEFKHGEDDQGCAIFETILTSDPKKVNIWVTYIDQLVKKGQIEQARQVLERSVCQKLPLKNMKSLFMKFRKFEEEHGTPAAIEAVKIRAQEYIEKLNKLH